MDKQLIWVRAITEEGDNVNPYAEILPGDTSAPVHSLAMTFQEPSRSRDWGIFMKSMAAAVSLCCCAARSMYCWKACP